jgi:threonine/homoserine/homoserine lactone efflux protein
MACLNPKRWGPLDIAPALYAALLLLWFRGLLNNAGNPWNHLFFVAAIAVFLSVLASEKV